MLPPILNQIQVGCQDCDVPTARNSCSLGYHLCLNTEYYSFASKQAQELSIDQLSKGQILIYDSLELLRNQSKGTAICCLNF